MSLKSILTKEIISWKAIIIIVAVIYFANFIFHYFSVEGQCERKVNQTAGIVKKALNATANKMNQMSMDAAIKMEVDKCVRDSKSIN